jgi:hypothetical protein
MTVLSISINDQVFDKKSSEVQYLLRVLDLLKNEIGRSQGKATSGTIVGVSPTGVANTSLGSWTYASSGNKD